jgi:DNA-binding CsgD family transcriptional regulator
LKRRKRKIQSPRFVTVSCPDYTPRFETGLTFAVGHMETTHSKEQFEMLARYQCKKQTFEEIAEIYKVDVETVKKTCREIANIIGLQLRGDAAGNKTVH